MNLRENIYLQYILSLLSKVSWLFSKDQDGKLNLKEYMANVFGETENAADWELGKIQFQQFRDKNKDGAIDKHELKVTV